MTLSPSGSPPLPSRCLGMALAMSLIFLLLLTILAITAIGTGVLQEKMAGNLRDQDVAFQAAESALRGGENRINQLAAAGRPVPVDNPSGIWTLLSLNDQILNDTWWQANSTLHDSGVQLAYENPRYVIEEYEFVRDSLGTGHRYGSPSGVYYYRVTARAVGATPNSQAALQSTYRVRYE